MRPRMGSSVKCEWMFDAEFGAGRYCRFATGALVRDVDSKSEKVEYLSGFFTVQTGIFMVCKLRLS